MQGILNEAIQSLQSVASFNLKEISLTLIKGFPVLSIVCFR